MVPAGSDAGDTGEVNLARCFLISKVAVAELAVVVFPPAPDLVILSQRTRVLPACCDLDDTGQIRHFRRQHVLIRPLADADLPLVVVAPAPDRATRCQCTGVVRAGGDPDDTGKVNLARCILIISVVVAELAGVVISPAPDLAILSQRTRIIATGGNLDDTGQIHHFRRQHILIRPFADADLPFVVFSPAPDCATRCQCTGVVPAGGNLGKTRHGTGRFHLGTTIVDLNLDAANRRSAVTSSRPGHAHRARFDRRKNICDLRLVRRFHPRFSRPGRRAQLQDEYVVAAVRGEVGSARTRVEVDRVPEKPGGVHVARRVDRHRIAKVITGAAEALGPQVVARRVQLRNEHVPVAVRGEVGGARTRVEVDRVIEVSGGVHVARRVDRHRIAAVGTGVAEALGPHQVPGRVQRRCGFFEHPAKGRGGFLLLVGSASAR